MDPIVLAVLVEVLVKNREKAPICGRTAHDPKQVIPDSFLGLLGCLRQAVQA
jgi:hypothetical protein